MNGLLAFRAGLSRTFRYWPAIGLLLAANALSAGLLALIPAAGLLGASYRTPFRDAADGVDPWLLLETFESAPVDTTLGEAAPGAGTRQILLTSLIVIAVAVPLAWLASAFLSGGVLLTYAESRVTFDWRRFLWGSWRWFSAFLLLGSIQGIIMVVLGLPLGIVAIVLLFGSLRWLGWILVVIVALLGFVGLALAEYTGVYIVLRQTRNPFTGIGQAFRYLLRHPRQWVVLYGLALLLLLLVNVVYYFGLDPYLPLAWWPLLLGARQVFIAARLWARLVRWAGAMATVEQESWAAR